MVQIKKGLIGRLAERITSGEDVADLAKDTNLPLEDILAIAHGVYGVEVKPSGALTEEQCDYLRSCIQHRVSYESIGEWLGVEVNKMDSKGHQSKDVQGNRPKLVMESKLSYDWFDALDKIGERSSRDPDLMQESAETKIAFLISQFGKIASMYATLNANRESYQRFPEHIMAGIRLAEALTQDIAAYKEVFVDRSSPIFAKLKGPLEEIEGDLENLRGVLTGRFLALG